MTTPTLPGVQTLAEEIQQEQIELSNNLNMLLEEENMHEDAISAALSASRAETAKTEALLLKDESLNYKNLSEAAKTAAEAARDIAQLSSGIFTNTTLGLEATTNQQYFSVPQAFPSDIMFDLYKNNAGVALYINSYSSSSLIKYSIHAQHQYNFVDADGFIIACISDGTIKTITNTTGNGLVDAGTFSIQYLIDSVSQALTLRDVDGFIFAIITALGKLKTTAFEINSGLLDVQSWKIENTPLLDGYFLVDADGFILLSINQTDGLQAIGLTDSNTTLSTLPHARKIVLFGDSRTEQNSVSPLTSQRMTRLSDFGYANWAHYFTNANFDIVYNAGISGNTTAQLLSRFNTDILPYEPDELWGEAGINDVQAGTSEATTIANLASIFDLCDANGIYVRWSTISPLYTGQAHFTAANVAKITNINRWLREQAIARKNITIVDSWSALIDRSSTTGSASSGVLQTDDNIHQSPKGAKLQGYAFAQSFIKDHDIIDYLPQFVGDRYSLDSASKQLFDNPLFTASGGTNNTSGVVTGTIPLNARISKTGTWGAGLVTSALVARSDGFGYDWVLTVTNAGAENDTLTIAFDDMSARVANGDSIKAMCELSLSNLAKNRGVKFEIASTVNSVFSSASTMEYTAYQPTGIVPDPQNAWTDDMYNQDTITGVLCTPLLKLGVTGAITNTYPVFTFRFGGIGSTAVIKIGRLAVYKN